MTKLWSLCVLITLPGRLAAQSPDPAKTVSATASAPSSAMYTPLTPGQKVRRRALRLIEPVTLVSSAFGAGIEQWRNVPEAWGQGY
jgi:hypothetical protein